MMKISDESTVLIDSEIYTHILKVYFRSENSLNVENYAVELATHIEVTSFFVFDWHNDRKVLKFVQRDNMTSGL